MDHVWRGSITITTKLVEFWRLHRALIFLMPILPSYYPRAWYEALIARTEGDKQRRSRRTKQRAQF